MSFYSCPHIGCNRKYKTIDKLKSHSLMNHEKILEDSDISEPTIITKENKKELKSKIDAEKIKKVKQKEMDEIKLRLMEQERIKKEVELKFRKDEELRFLALEESKLRENEEQIRLKNIKIAEELKIIEFNNKCRQNAELNSSDCCICMVNLSDSAPVPCGHKKFCYECIENYHNTNPMAGCPICREKIQSISKIFL